MATGSASEDEQQAFASRAMRFCRLSLSLSPSALCVCVFAFIWITNLDVQWKTQSKSERASVFALHVGFSIFST